MHTTPYGASAYHPPGPRHRRRSPSTRSRLPAATRRSQCPTTRPDAQAARRPRGPSSALATGAAIASANTAAATSNAYSAGVAAGSANTAAATSSADNAGVAAGVSYAMQANYATLPPGSMSINKGGATYYLGRGYRVPAGLRSERRLLPRGASALMNCRGSPRNSRMEVQEKLSSALLGLALARRVRGRRTSSSHPPPPAAQIEAGSTLPCAAADVLPGTTALYFQDNQLVSPAGTRASTSILRAHAGERGCRHRASMPGAFAV